MLYPEKVERHPLARHLLLANYIPAPTPKTHTLLILSRSSALSEVEELSYPNDAKYLICNIT